MHQDLSLQMEEESMLTRRSLTMLPLEVIESVSAIREYLMDQEKVFLVAFFP